MTDDAKGDEKQRPLTERESLLISNIRSAAEDVSRSLGGFLAWSSYDTNDALYAVKVRVKSQESFEQKVLSRREKNPGYSPYDVTDVVGVRFITLFRDNLVETTDQVLEWIIKGERPFAKEVGIKELIVYRSDRASAPIIEGVKKRGVSRLGSKFSEVFRDPPDKGTGYSSIHIVTFSDTSLKKAPMRTQPYTVPMEIQIRTVFEDAWGEIDHKYRYKVLESGPSSARSRNYFVQKSIDNLKGYTDACAEHANLIYQEATTKAEIIASPSPQKLADSDEAVVSILAAYDVALEIRRQIMESRRRFGEAETLLQVDPDKAIKTLIQNADELKAARESAFGDRPTYESEADRTSLFYLLMDEALSRYATDVRDEVDKAVGLYLEVLKKIGPSPIVEYRLGNAYDSQGSVEDALESFLEAGRLIIAARADRAEPNTPENYQSWGADTAAERLPVSTGYIYWKLARQAEDDTRRAELLERAYSETLPGLDSKAVKTRRDALNNALYYAVDARSLLKTSPAWAADGRMRELRDQLIAVAGGTTVKDHHKELDTLMCAYDRLGDIDEAVTYASRLVELLFPRQEKGVLKPADSEILGRAANILQKAQRREKTAPDPKKGNVEQVTKTEK